MPDRGALASAFLDGAGWAGARRAALAGDASNRRYERLTDPRTGSRAVLMDAPPERGEDVDRFVRITRHLRAIGLSAPALLAIDTRHGFLLLEDLGDALFARVILRQPELERALYTAATDVLLAVQRHAPPPDLSAPAPALMADLVAPVFDWYVPGASAQTVSSDAREAFLAVTGSVLKQFADRPRVLCLRDYHAENLLWLRDRGEVRRVGLLDYQDAMLAHPAYDLVSLLQDARRDVPAALEREMIAHFITAGGHDEEPFRAAYAALGAQRNLRILGVFARLGLHFGKPGYARLIPRVWAHLQADLAHPSLAGLRAQVNALLPAPTPAALNRIMDQCGTIPTL